MDVWIYEICRTIKKELIKCVHSIWAHFQSCYTSSYGSDRKVDFKVNLSVDLWKTHLTILLPSWWGQRKNHGQCSGMKTEQVNSNVYCSAAVWRNFASSLLAEVPWMSVINFFHGYNFFFSIPTGIQEIKKSNPLRSKGLCWGIMLSSLCYHIRCLFICSLFNNALSVTQ
jgi:hypothetical protein